MTTTVRMILTIVLAASFIAGAHSDDTNAGFHSARLGSKAMTDPALSGYEMVFITLHLDPGGRDLRPHRHEADVYGVVLEGSVVIELDGASIGTFARGEVFTEPFNAVHSAIRNASATEPATVIAMIPMRKDRKLYVPVGQ